MKKLAVFSIRNGVPVLGSKPLALVKSWADVRNFYSKNLQNAKEGIAVYNCKVNKDKISTKEFYCTFNIQNNIEMMNLPF